MRETPTVNPEDVAGRIAGGATLIDVREQHEWDAGHAKVAIHVPLGDLAANLERLPGDGEILAICRSGGRSGQATEFLIGQGRIGVNVAGGMNAWRDAGLEVVRDDGEDGDVV